MREALKLALEALEKLTGAAEGFSVSGVYFNEELQNRKCLDDAYDAMGFAQEALAQPEQEPVGMYRNKCADGSRCLHGCHTNESCFTSSQPQPEQEAVECDCNQGQSCHVCDPYFPFDSAPQTTRLTQKTTTNDVAIGVDVTEDGTHVTAMRMRPDGINIVIYSQFHPLAQPEQEPVAEGWCDGCNPDNCQGCGPAAKPKHEPIFWYRPVGEDGGYEGPIHNGAIEKVRKLSGVWKPLYTTPPQRTWVGLTPKEELDAESVQIHGIEAVIKWVEAKLKEKNT